jgi:thymidylate synthase (FAD)
MKISPCNVVLRKVDGTELDIVNAARVSFHKESEWENKDEQMLNTYSYETGSIYHEDPQFVGKLSDRDIKLINYLASHGHWTPFGHVNATFVVKAPLFVARQLGKHQVGLVWNEVSRRYVDEEPEFWFPANLRLRAENIKQGSSENLWKRTEDKPDLLEWAYSQANEQLNFYNECISENIAPEQARMFLPQNMMTEWWWTGSLAAWSRVFKLRLDPQTQQETRDVCRSMYELLLPSFPNALPALMNGVV